MNTDLAMADIANTEQGLAEVPVPSTSSAANNARKRLSRRARGRICLCKANKAVRQTCTTLRSEAREEMVSALMPALWRRVRNWRLRDKSFAEFAEQSAFQSLKDHLRRIHSSRDALDRMAVALGEFGDGV